MHFYGIWSHFEALEVDQITWGVIFMAYGVILKH
jgi:hypothetical protein